MAVKCVLKKSSGMLSEVGKVYPEVARFSRIDADSFVNYVVQNCQVSHGQVMSILSAVENQLSMFLSNGHTVEVPRLGTFSVTVNGSAEQDDDGHWHIKDGKVGSVRLKPSAAMLQSLDGTKFELVNGLIYEHPRLTEEEAMSVIRTLCAEDGFFTVKSYRQVTRESQYYARKSLRALVNAGKLTCNASGHTVIFRLPAEQ